MPGISERLLAVYAPSHTRSDSSEDRFHHAIAPG
jgi:hypothetical protein